MAIKTAIMTAVYQQNFHIFLKQKHIKIFRFGICHISLILVVFERVNKWIASIYYIRFHFIPANRCVIGLEKPLNFNDFKVPKSSRDRLRFLFVLQLDGVQRFLHVLRFEVWFNEKLHEATQSRFRIIRGGRTSDATDLLRRSRFKCEAQR